MSELKIGSAGLANFLTTKVARHACENVVKIIAREWDKRGVPEMEAEAFQVWALEKIAGLTDAQVREMDLTGFTSAIGFAQLYTKIAN